MIKSGQTWAGSFVTLDATGAVTAATGTPVGVLYVDGVSNGATVTITGSNPYKWSVTLPTLTAGQRVDMYIAATIDTIATAGIVASAQADTVLLSDGVTLADDAITASKFDESTAYPLKSADTGTTQVARVGADSDTLETLSNQLDAVQAKTDLLDVSSVIVSSAISGTAITILRGDTFECSISDLGSLADYVSLDFTVKSDKSDADTAALIRIRLNATGLTDGLLTLNGATASNADDGSIAITDAAAGDITITLAASCTDDLATGTYAYDVQLIEASEVSTLTSGKATVIADVTRAVA